MKLFLFLVLSLAVFCAAVADLPPVNLGFTPAGCLGVLQIERNRKILDEMRPDLKPARVIKVHSCHGVSYITAHLHLHAVDILFVF